MAESDKEESTPTPNPEEGAAKPASEELGRAAFDMAAETAPGTDPLSNWSPPEASQLDGWLDGYDVEELIGRGGMGAVYRAVQVSLDRTVAIKLLPEELTGDPDFAERFGREAKSMAQLNHPNIVQVFDFGQSSQGHWFFAMEYVEGVDFHRLIRSGGLETDQALRSVCQICDALAYAHGKGLVHRDIKPANIMLDDEQTIKIGDFGLAKLIDPAGGGAEKSVLTMSGTAMGTPFYIAPEQLSGGVVDQRADIYSLGVMFYEMLTGSLPQGAFEPPSTRSKSKLKLDVRIDEVVLRAMAAEPEFRYQTAGDVRTDVDKVLSDKEGNAEKSPKRSRGRGLAVVGLIFVAAILWAAFWGYGHFVDQKEVAEKFSADAGKPKLENSTTSEEEDTDADSGKWPLPLPVFPPPLPTEKCRVVILPIGKEPMDGNEAWVRELEEKDWSDVVKLGDSPPDAELLFVIRAGGIVDVVGEPEWKELLANSSFSETTTTIVATENPTHLFSLDDEGFFSLHSPESGGRRVMNKDTAEVGAMMKDDWLVGLTKSGRLFDYRNELQPDIRFLETPPLSDIETCNSWRGSALTRDGAWHRIFRGALSEILHVGEGRFRGLVSNAVAIDERGRPWGLETGSTTQQLSKRWEKNHVPDQAFELMQGRAIKEADGNWGLEWVERKWDQGSSDRWHSLDVGSAVKDAVDIRFIASAERDEKGKNIPLIRKSAHAVIALLPAESVPRSGFWKVDDLIVARQGLAKVREESASGMLD